MRKQRDSTPYFDDEEAAFEDAVKQGHMSPDFGNPHYWDHYMYLGTEWVNGVHEHMFKHSVTRCCIKVVRQG